MQFTDGLKNRPTGAERVLKRLRVNSIGKVRPVSDERVTRILVLGNCSTFEMRDVMDAVLSCFPDSEIRIQPASFELAAAGSEWVPTLVVVCQTWPDEFSRADVLWMFARFPLARWVCCCGLWCESDGRNRDAWPIGVRVPARNALGRLLHERDVLTQRRAAADRRPRGSIRVRRLVSCLQAARCAFSGLGAHNGPPEGGTPAEGRRPFGGPRAAAVFRRAAAGARLRDSKCRRRRLHAVRRRSVECGRR